MYQIKRIENGKRANNHRRVICYSFTTLNMQKNPLQRTHWTWTDISVHVMDKTDMDGWIPQMVSIEALSHSNGLNWWMSNRWENVQWWNNCIRWLSVGYPIELIPQRMDIVSCALVSISYLTIIRYLCITCTVLILSSHILHCSIGNHPLHTTLLVWYSYGICPAEVSFIRCFVCYMSV